IDPMTNLPSMCSFTWTRKGCGERCQDPCACVSAQILRIPVRPIYVGQGQLADLRHCLTITEQRRTASEEENPIRTVRHAVNETRAICRFLIMEGVAQVISALALLQQIVASLSLSGSLGC